MCVVKTRERGRGKGEKWGSGRVRKEKKRVRSKVSLLSPGGEGSQSYEHCVQRWSIPSEPRGEEVGVESDSKVKGEELEVELVGSARRSHRAMEIFAGAMRLE